MKLERKTENRKMNREREPEKRVIARKEERRRYSERRAGNLPSSPYHRAKRGKKEGKEKGNDVDETL